MEQTAVGTTNYYSLLGREADSVGYTLDTAMNSPGRTLIAKSIYSLQGVASLPASTWTLYYRAWQDLGSSSTTTLTKSPSASSGSWENPSYAYADGGGQADSPKKDQAETFSGYGFAIPAGAQITQVRVRLDAYCSGNDYSQLRVSDDGGAHWLRTTIVNPTTSEATYWVTVTDWTKWTPEKLNGENLQTQVTHKKRGGADTVSLDWIPVEVTYSTESATGHIDVDLKVIKSDGSTRSTLATNVASSSSLTSSAATLSATYSFTGYTVVDQTDCLEVDYFVDVSAAGSTNAYLRIDDSTLPESAQTRITGVSYSSAYRLTFENSFSIDLQSCPLSSIQSLEVLFRYNVSSIAETWLVKAYNWGTLAFSNVDFNDTSGTHPAATGTWNNYALSLTDDWEDYVSPDGTVTLQVSDANLGATQISLSVDFLGVRPVVDEASLSLRNSGSQSVHVVALWIIDSAAHIRYDVDLFLNSGESAFYFFGDDITLPDGSYMVKLVTERGNIAVISTNW
ncbi:MAG: hypothetical protein NWF00_02015 [Candidatus Bathyarchaeota archaeon]|nr:hypothetical protein [Candidatus Bathyarchaeota archaeon]